MVEKNLLPIGSVVLLKGATKKIMVIGYLQQLVGKQETYDYVGCLYPEGFIASDKNLLFNHEQIAKVFLKATLDEEAQEFYQNINEVFQKMHSSRSNQDTEIIDIL